jgi:transcriptional regulator with XRE-family HTH domain
MLQVPTGEQIRTFRKQKRWTQKQMADLVYVTVRQVQRWESGEQKIPLAS